MKNIAILLLTWNRHDFTRQCLETYFKNTGYPHRLVIMDNGSSDGTREFLETLKAPDHIKLEIIYNKKNLGITKTTNNFWRTAKEEYIGKVDNDFLMPEGWLTRFAEILDVFPKIGLVGAIADTYLKDPAIKYKDKKLYMAKHLGGNYLMKKRLIDTYGYLDERNELYAWTLYQWKKLHGKEQIIYDPEVKIRLLNKEYPEKYPEYDKIMEETRKDTVKNGIQKIAHAKKIMDEIKKKNLVSLIMPVWDQLEYTKKALSSLKSYTSYPWYELIIINNGSSDGTRKWLEENWADKKGVTIIHNSENLGWIKALNQGIRTAKGKFIGILNNDILFSRDWLKKILNHFKDPTVGAVGPTSNYVSGRQLTSFNNGYYNERANFLIGFCLIFRKKLIKQVGEFDEGFGFGGAEEIDYAIRIKEKTRWKMEIARDVFIWHKGHSSLRQLPGFDKDYHKNNQQKLEDKWGKEKGTKIYKIPPKALIIVPNSGTIHHRHYRSMVLMSKPPLTHFLEIPQVPVQIARNMGVRFAQGINAEYIFFVDSDQIVTEDLLAKLLQHNKDIVGIVTHTRHDPHFPCVFRRHKDKEHDDWASIDIRYQGLVEVDGIGMGAILIHSRVFDAIKDPWFEFSRFGEDLTFMEKARQSGFKIWCDTDIILTHIGKSHLVTEQTFLEAKSLKEAREKIPATGGEQGGKDGTEDHTEAVPERAGVTTKQADTRSQ